MEFPQAIGDNLRFLISEVSSQLDTLRSALAAETPAAARSVLDRRGYGLNLMRRIHESTLEHLVCPNGEVEGRSTPFRSVEIMAYELELMTKRCREVVTHYNAILRTDLLHAQLYEEPLEIIHARLAMVEPAFHNNDTTQALKICRTEKRVYTITEPLRRRYTKALKKGKHTEDLIAALFLVHNIEKMGQTMRTVGEAVLSINLGQTTSIERFQSLTRSIDEMQDGLNVGELELATVAETRSGSGISGIRRRPGKKKMSKKGKHRDMRPKSEDVLAILKEGHKAKLKEEWQGVESWHSIVPGLAPRILSYQKKGQAASLLIEHLAGLTFEQIVLNEPQPRVDEALQHIGKTLGRVWRETHTAEPVSADYMGQLGKRLKDVWLIHPDFQYASSHICGFKLPDFESQIARAVGKEKKLIAPFSVYIHGDFNVDNIIYDPLEKQINFIDLHRSRYMDYIQDISVFMVSNYRLQVLDPQTRKRIAGVAQEMYHIARRYALKHGDETFEIRLAMGLARSFATSTRFVLDKDLAWAMFSRAQLLIHQVLDTPVKRAAHYRLPIEELFIV
ncbi:aminoglycoside phosphotransferase family protein [Magnetococcus sp. PR-3]|uniref:aminoglycoside phosphotransferase family protein n=1 Tax=Magnetococcus sp. PR-3 TaxID=3120355 RepID=UPI002FCE3F85